MANNIWDRYVGSAAERYGVPPDIISSVINVESSGRAGAVSPKGAGGLMQLMPATYREIADKHGLGPDRFDPRNNIMAGAAYLRENYDRFGNWDRALAAYNAGPSRVARGGPLPRETQNYVPKVQAGIGQDQGAGVANTFNDVLKKYAGQSLLDVDEDKNFYEGLGGIWNVGQTPSQPPAIDAAAMPGSTQTDRLGVGSRMNDLVQQLLQQSPQQRQPAVSPLQYQLAGAGQAVGQLAGVRDRKVGIGELLGALGGGLTRGQLAGDQAQRADRADQFQELGSLGKIQSYQRDEAARGQRAQAVAAVVQRLRAAGRNDEAAMIEANPDLLDKLAEQQFKPPEEYTLGQGETRFRGNQPIAAGAPKPLDTSTMLSAEEVSSLGLPVGTVAQRDSNGKVSVVSTPRDEVGGQFDRATKLRNEFTTQAKPLADMRQHYGRMEAAYNDNSGQADIALVYSFMKMLDPTSVVRETEFATAENATGVPDRIRQLWNKTLNGERLPPQARDDMLKQGSAQYATIEKQHSEIEQRYRDLAVQNGLDPRNVVIDFRGGVKLPDAGGKPGGLGNGGGMPDPNNPKQGDRMRNPSTGAQIEWNGSAWVPVQ